MPTPALILASTSPFRRELLARFGLPFEVVAPGTDEAEVADESPVGRAQRLALAKARAVAARHPGALVIGSDQVAVCRGRILDKPGNAARCAEQLSWVSGYTARFHTAVAVLCAERDYQREFADLTDVEFRRLTPEAIAHYVERERPFECAGSFRCEALGITLVKSIRAEDPTGLIGLPLMSLAAALRPLGFALP